MVGKIEENSPFCYTQQELVARGDSGNVGPRDSQWRDYTEHELIGSQMVFKSQRPQKN